MEKAFEVFWSAVSSRTTVVQIAVQIGSNLSNELCCTCNISWAIVFCCSENSGLGIDGGYLVGVGFVWIDHNEPPASLLKFEPELF